MLFPERVINAIRLLKRKPNKGLSYVDKNRDVCDDGGPHNRLPLRHGIYDLILVQLSANQKLRCCPLTQFKDMFVGTRFKLIWQGFLLE